MATRFIMLIAVLSFVMSSNVFARGKYNFKPTWVVKELSAKIKRLERKCGHKLLNPKIKFDKCMNRLVVYRATKHTWLHYERRAYNQWYYSSETPTANPRKYDHDSYFIAMMAKQMGILKGLTNEQIKRNARNPDHTPLGKEASERNQLANPSYMPPLSGSARVKKKLKQPRILKKKAKKRKRKKRMSKKEIRKLMQKLLKKEAKKRRIPLGVIGGG